jgi:hypothetical protein
MTGIGRVLLDVDIANAERPRDRPRTRVPSTVPPACDGHLSRPRLGGLDDDGITELPGGGLACSNPAMDSEPGTTGTPALTISRLQRFCLP